LEVSDYLSNVIQGWQQEDEEDDAWRKIRVEGVFVVLLAVPLAVVHSTRGRGSTPAVAHVAQRAAKRLCANTAPIEGPVSSGFKSSHPE